MLGWSLEVRLIRAGTRTSTSAAAELREKLVELRAEREALRDNPRSTGARSRLHGLEIRLLEALAVMEAGPEAAQRVERDPDALESELRALIRTAPPALLDVIEAALAERHGVAPRLVVVEGGE